MQRLPGLLAAACCSVVLAACYGAGDGKDSPAVGGSTSGAGSTSSMGSSGSSGTAGSGAGSAAGAPSDNEDCAIGKSCECSTGLVGSTVCVDDVEMCDCATCPVTPPVDTDPAFVACGGEPFGTWGAAEVDLTAAKWSFTAGPGAPEVSCPAADMQAETPVFMLRLDDGGAGAVYFSDIAGSGHVLSSCLESVGACSDFPNCEPGPCGTCECQTVPGEARSDALVWVRNESQLTLTIGATAKTFEYCVQGDTLTLMPTDGSDLVYTLKSGYAHGAPVACSLREVDECASTGCHVGVCYGAGGTCAEGTDETSCSNRSGCTWDPAQCAGDIVPCELEHYGTAPGCEFTVSAVCSGTPSPCDTKLNINACDDTPGCYWGDAVGCNGTAGACSEVPLDTCQTVVGCDITPG